MSTTLQDRICKRLQQLGLRETDVAKLAGVTRSFLHDVLRGRSKRPNPEKLSRVATALKVDLHWLLTGQGNIQGIAPFDEGADEDFIAIPYVEARPSMGGGAVVEEPVETGRDFHFRRAWIRGYLKAAPSMLRVMTVQGDSMIPTLQDGDVVLVDMNQRNPIPPGVFVLHDGMGLVAKRLEYIPMSDPPRVRIISDNHQYHTYEGIADEVNIIGRVRWYGREM
jgi:phage repressor protein C with HTH and peptisase S24 domain